MQVNVALRQDFTDIVAEAEEMDPVGNAQFRG